PSPDPEEARAQRDTLGPQRRLGHQHRDVVSPRLRQKEAVVTQTLSRRRDADKRFAPVLERHDADADGCAAHRYPRVALYVATKTVLSVHCFDLAGERSRP